jgi:protein-L-isoaspartate(D-aspartate) O-methyltransferase
VASAATLRRRLVRQLEEKGLLRDRRVRAAFLDVSREQFVPEYAKQHGLEAVYRDDAIVTKKTEAGHGLSSSSQPGIMAEMLDHLRLEQGQRVLEIGAGTGYNAAILARAVGDEGRVVTVELDPDTARAARRALRETRVKVVTGDGRDGYPAGAPYDRIIVTASASEVPRAWLDQLARGGLVEVPLRLRPSAGLQLIPTLRRENGTLRSVSVVCGGFMPLRTSPEDREPYWPMLKVELSAGDSGSTLFVLGGESLRALSPRSARRLAAAVCSTPSIRRLGMRAQAKSLAVYLTLRGPTRRIVGAFDGGLSSKNGGPQYLGGIVGPRSSGAALLLGWPTTSRMLVYGDPDPADELAALVQEWDANGRPGEADFSVSVHFRNGRSTVRTRWRGR